MMSQLRFMMSLTVLVLVVLLVEIPGASSRPKDKHRDGLYDEWKTVPFVDSPGDSSSKYSDFEQNLGNSDNTNKFSSKYIKMYEKYNSEHGRDIGGGNSSNETNINASETNNVDSALVLTPVEGGTEDMTSERGKLRANGKERKPRRDREGKKNIRHHKSVKKELSDEKMKKKELRRQKRKLEGKNKRKTEKEEEVDQDGINIEEFYKEHPNFKKNVATISDKTEDNKVTTTTNTYAKNNLEEHTDGVSNKIESNSEDDYVQKDAAVFDDNDDDDDHIENHKNNQTDSKSNDVSSEAFNDYYDYYDEDGDSSYSSSEERAEQEMRNQVPSDWLNQYDRMYGDQPVPSETQSGKPKDDEAFLDEKNQVKATKEGKSFAEKLALEGKDKIPKTDVEPSTSPNPPTPKKDVKSTVTQPANPQWKERIETWNLIESKPVESCSENLDCPNGRMCKFGLCLCGQPDFCHGHYKPVCGNDGRLYPSHCELHRTACVLGVHISPDKEMKCQPKVEDLIDVSKLLDTADAEVTTEVHAETTKLDNPSDHTSVPVTQQTILHIQNESMEVKSVDSNINAENKVDTVLKTAFDKLKSEENKQESNVVESKHEDDQKKSQDTDVVKDAGTVALINQPLDVNKESYSHDEAKDTKDGKTIDSNITGKKFDFASGTSEDNNDTSGNITHKEDNVTDKHSVDKDDDDSYGYEYDDDDVDDYADDYDDDIVSVAKDSSEESVELSDPDKSSLVPLFCTPDLYMKFKADVLEYHCIFFEEQHCDRQTQEEKQKLAIVMFNYFDRDFSGFIEKEELWELQLLEHMDELSTLCTLLDIATFDQLGERDGKLSVDEFIQAFDIPDLLEHKEEVVPLLATVGNGLEVKCDITESTDIVWKRNGIDLGLLSFPGISVLGDGSLYLETVGFHMVGNLSCYDRQKPSLKQIHQLTVQKPPQVYISVVSHDQIHGNSFDIQCHAEGYPKPTITWDFKGNLVQQGAKYHIQTSDNTLTVLSAEYNTDTGTYACHARNSAGEAMGSVLVTVHNPNNTDHTELTKLEESFIIFHDNGYTMHEPKECLTQRHVQPDFGNFFFIPDELDAPPSLCEKGIPCIWGGAVNVRDTFVYATQPRENRVVVIDVADTFNPNQVIFTDHNPVALHYIAHLDEVWILCWNGEDDNGSKTIVVIRNASQRTQHHAVHTQPIGNRFDQVQDVFLPPDSELHLPYQYGYTVHNGQKGLFKISLQEKKYSRAVDFTKYECVPTSVSFVPLGGNVLVECEKKTQYGSTTSILTMDYITDVVIDNVTLIAKPYVSPDSSVVVMVEEATGKIAVLHVDENGEIKHQFDVAVGSPVGKATFHKASYNHGYDLYLTSTQNPYLFSVSLENGRVDLIKDIREPDSEMYLPWFKKQRPLVSGDVFSDYLATTAMSSMLIVNGKQHSIQCDYRDLQNPAVIAFSHLRT